MAENVMILSDFDKVMCPSCGSTTSSTRFCAEEHVPGPGGSPGPNVRRMGSVPHPHIHRQCSDCAFEWLTETLSGMIRRLASSGKPPTS